MACSEMSPEIRGFYVVNDSLGWSVSVLCREIHCPGCHQYFGFANCSSTTSMLCWQRLFWDPNGLFSVSTGSLDPSKTVPCTPAGCPEPPRSSRVNDRQRWARLASSPKQESKLLAFFPRVSPFDTDSILPHNVSSSHLDHAGESESQFKRRLTKKTRRDFRQSNE